MSYTRPNTGDSINNMITNMVEFLKISKHLIEAKDVEEFELWFEQAELIDKRSLYLFLCDHKDEINEEHLNYVKNRFVFI